jgi:hypothetical protein
VPGRLVKYTSGCVWGHFKRVIDKREDLSSMWAVPSHRLGARGNKRGKRTKLSNAVYSLSLFLDHREVNFPVLPNSPHHDGLKPCVEINVSSFELLTMEN